MKEVVQNTNSSNVSKANRSFRWTAAAELLSKIIVPVMNMVLARFIAPSIFGIVAILNVVIVLCTTLAESGFGRYVQQHQFNDEAERIKSNKTSLTSSVVFGLILFAIIAIWRFPIAKLIGAEGYENYLLIIGISIPFHSITSVESAILIREFRFKESCVVRVSTVLIVAAFEIIVAILGYGLISLTIGPLISSVVTAILLFLFLKNKRIIGFSFKHFRQSFVTNAFFILESLCVWAASALDVLLLKNAFNETIVGVYKLAFTTEQGIVAIIGSVFSPVLISLLSKIPSDDPSFKGILSKYQKAFAFLSFPMGVGMFVFRDGITNILMGEGWDGATLVFGYFAIADAFKIAISNFISTLMISKGKPQGSILSQLFYLGAIALCCSFADKLGFETFVICRTICIFILVFAYTCFCKLFTGICPLLFYKNILRPLLASVLMGILCYCIAKYSSGIVITIIGVVLGLAFYLILMISLFKEDFNNFFDIIFDGKKLPKLKRK